MAKAHVTLPNGTTVEIEGTADEVRQLLEFYGSPDSAGKKRTPAPTKKKRQAKKSSGGTSAKSTGDVIDLTEIVNHIKNCDEAEAIETQILDRTSLVNRTLLPLYIVHEHLDDHEGLTSGDISRATIDLGIPIGTPNVSRTLSNTASKYVMGDKVRKKGRPVRYKLSRRGVQYMKKVLDGS
ncbi:MAG: hypothetical protein K0U72_11800 [Gammaproteobacteria bacterium]|nr:hypothetical protein [Gammaproteobacteria bacterium]